MNWNDKYCCFLLQKYSSFTIAAISLFNTLLNSSRTWRFESYKTAVLSFFLETAKSKWLRYYWNWDRVHCILYYKTPQNTFLDIIKIIQSTWCGSISRTSISISKPISISRSSSQPGVVPYHHQPPSVSPPHPKPLPRAARAPCGWINGGWICQRQSLDHLVGGQLLGFTAEAMTPSGQKIIVLQGCHWYR